MFSILQWFKDKLRIFHANQTAMRLDPHEIKEEVGTVKLV